MIDRDSAEHRAWGDGCEAWTFVAHPDLHVMLERMPAGTAERPHRHAHVRQLYFILSGSATVLVDGDEAQLDRGQALAIAPGSAHQMRNDSAHPLEFLVISSSAPREDRIELD